LEFLGSTDRFSPPEVVPVSNAFPEALTLFIFHCVPEVNKIDVRAHLVLSALLLAIRLSRVVLTNR
jgi:hypothetical protein